MKGFLLDKDHTEPHVHKQFHNIKEQKACKIYMSVWYRTDYWHVLYNITIPSKLCVRL